MILTTSWDDGHPLDLKLLGLLEKYNLKATFYIPLSNSENPVMGKSLIQELSTYQEIGGHTISHTYLNHLSDPVAKYEITQCKVLLEEIIGKPLYAFCFPGGKFSNRDVLFMKNAGYLFGRTTNLLSASNPKFNLMNTSIQTQNHSSTTLLRHCIKRFNIGPILHNSFFLPFNKSFLKLAEYNLLKCRESNSVFHIWGHSWEIERFNLWNQLEDLFKLISSLDRITYLNNTETWKSICEKSKTRILSFNKNDKETVGITL
ncbi:MAG: polysaccharide deacetylase family protein [Bacteroidota bacterium]|nr:polysaccharide deacetylase family protein [Bacteroidota bacterium]